MITKKYYLKDFKDFTVITLRLYDKDKPHWHRDWLVDCNKIVDLLNELHEENQQLKQENKELLFAYDECSNNKLFSRRKLETENKNLKDENQSLKAFIKQLRSCDGKIYLMNGMVYNTKVLNFE